MESSNDLVSLAISLAEDRGITPPKAAKRVARAAGRNQLRLDDASHAAVKDLGKEISTGDMTAIRVLAILHLAQS